MTDLNATRAAKAHRYIMAAQELIDAGFPTKAAQKTAMGYLNRAYADTREIVHDLVIDDARMSFPGCMEVKDGNDPLWQGYLAALRESDIPFDLHQVRDAHLAIINAFAPASYEIVKDLIAMRQVAKDTPIVPLPKNETKERIETVRKSIIDEIERRKAQYVEALDMARLFNGLPVTVNAHYVRHEQGTVYLRHYFYLRGKITPLQVLLAAADTYAREQEA